MGRWERRKKRARVWTRQSVTMDEESWRLIWSVAEEMDLGGKGFSAALRKILREWKAQRDLGAQRDREARLQLDREWEADDGAEAGQEEE